MENWKIKSRKNINIGLGTILLYLGMIGVIPAYADIVFYDGVFKGNATDTGYSGSQYLSFWLYDAGGAIDNIHVRKYASPEPSWFR